MSLTLFLIMNLAPTRTTLLPYTTLFRSTRATWRSTAIAGTPKAAPRTIDAVLRPTPCRRVRLCMSEGTSPHAERSEEHTSELQSLRHLVCRLLLEKKKTKKSYWCQHQER